MTIIMRKMKTREGENHPQCVICCDKIRSFCRLEQSPGIAEILSDLFRIFSKHMSWSNIKSKYKWRFSSEYFPFCSLCKLDVVSIYRRNEQIEGALKRISAIRQNLSAQVVETEKRLRKVKSCNSTLKPHDGPEEDQAPEVVKQNCYDSKIRYYRDATYRRFSPVVQISKEDTLPGTTNTELLKSKTQGNEKSGETSLIKSSVSCLICLEYVELYDYPSKSSAVAKILSNLFHVLSNYMEWEAKRRYSFNFKFESFPFCKKCRSRLVRIYKLDEKVQTVFQQIKKTVKNVSVKIRKSEINELFRTRSGLFKQGRRKLLYDAEKVRYYRGLTLRSDDLGEPGGKDISDSESEEKSDYVPTSASEDSSPSSDVESVSSGSVEDNNEEVSERLKKKSALLKHWKYSRRVSAKGEWNFMFDNKVCYELNTESHWVCNTCCKNLGPYGKSLFQHMATDHTKRETTGEVVVTVRDNREVRRYKVHQIGPNKFEFGGFFFDRVACDILRCSQCPYSTNIVENIAAHVVDKHVLVMCPPNHVNPLREGGYIRSVTNKSRFHCRHCVFSCTSINLMRRHLRKKHFEPSKYLPSTSLPDKIGGGGVAPLPAKCNPGASILSKTLLPQLSVLPRGKVTATAPIGSFNTAFSNPISVPPCGTTASTPYKALMRRHLSKKHFESSKNLPSTSLPDKIGGGVAPLPAKCNPGASILSKKFPQLSVLPLVNVTATAPISSFNTTLSKPISVSPCGSSASTPYKAVSTTTTYKPNAFVERRPTIVSSHKLFTPLGAKAIANNTDRGTTNFHRAPIKPFKVNSSLKSTGFSKPISTLNSAVDNVQPQMSRTFTLCHETGKIVEYIELD